MVIRTKHEYNKDTGYTTNQYWSLNCNFASNNLAAAYVDQPTNTNDNNNPNIPFNLNTMFNAANPMIGNKQYPNTEHVNENPIPLECIKFNIIYIPAQPKTLKPYI